MTCEVVMPPLRNIKGFVISLSRSCGSFVKMNKERFSHPKTPSISILICDKLSNPVSIPEIKDGDNVLSHKDAANAFGEFFASTFEIQYSSYLFERSIH